MPALGYLMACLRSGDDAANFRPPSALSRTCCSFLTAVGLSTGIASRSVSACSARTINRSLYSTLSLQDDEDDDRRQAERRAELELLRRRCLSRAAFMLATVLSESGRIREALRLADVIASEQHALHAVRCPNGPRQPPPRPLPPHFTHFQAIDPTELRKLLRLLADCATRALELGHDATGIPVVAHRE